MKRRGSSVVRHGTKNQTDGYEGDLTFESLRFYE